MLMLAVMVMKGRGRGTSPLARRVDHPSRADEHRIDASEHSEQICGWRKTPCSCEAGLARGRRCSRRRRPLKYACQRCSRVDQRHYSGVCIGAILGGRRALCRLAVLRLLGTSLGWLAGGPRVDGRTPARADRVRFPRNPAAGGDREGRTLMNTM